LRKYPGRTVDLLGVKDIGNAVWKMTKVRHLMMKNLVVAKGDVSIEKAVRILYTRHVGSVIVTDSEKRCIGIFTERDAIRVVAQKIPLKTPLKKVMTKKVVTIPEDASFAEARRKMTSRGIRHLPVVNEEGKLVGLLAIRRVLDEFLGTDFESA
jgi:CBS domain-containing protein